MVHCLLGSFLFLGKIGSKGKLKSERTYFFEQFLYVDTKLLLELASELLFILTVQAVPHRVLIIFGAKVVEGLRTIDGVFLM